MSTKSSQQERAERMAKALRANLRRRKQDGAAPNAAETLARRDAPLAPRMATERETPAKPRKDDE